MRKYSAGIMEGKEVYSGTMLGEEDDCPICLSILSSQMLPAQEHDSSTVATLPSCPHRFHLECILAWSKVSASCPCCKIHFQKMIFHNGRRKKVMCVTPKDSKVEDNESVDNGEEDEEDGDDGSCHICSEAEYVDPTNSSSLVGQLLTCQGTNCIACVHRFCVGVRDDEVGLWMCSECLVETQTAADPERTSPPEPRLPLCWTT